MNLCIHRGTNEIGGSCVEVRTDTTRIIIDIGMPLVNKDRSDFDFSKHKKYSIPELIENKILPNIKSLFDPSENRIDGILISHAHQDHYGFYQLVNPDIKLYLSEPTLNIIEISSVFNRTNFKIKNYSHFKSNEPFRIGDIKITPYIMDHSAFDSYAFLIENDGKSIFYSGDFRGHGRKWKVFKWFKYNCPKNVDYLILEGTKLGTIGIKNKSEESIEKEAIKIFSEPDKINLIYTSGQNIDRIVSFYKASIKTGKIFVVDVYVAIVLKIVSQYGAIPFPSENFENIKVYFPVNICNLLKKSSKQELFYQFKKYKITKDEIGSNPEKIVMLVRPGVKNYLNGISNLTGGNFIYSMWHGYLTKKATSDFLNYFEKKDFIIHHLHTGGHADLSILNEMADSIQPKAIIPIHTFEKDLYGKNFNFPIKQLNDEEILSF